MVTVQFYLLQLLKLVEHIIIHQLIRTFLQVAVAKFL